MRTKNILKCGITAKMRNSCVHFPLGDVQIASERRGSVSESLFNLFTKSGGEKSRATRIPRAWYVLIVYNLGITVFSGSCPLINLANQLRSHSTKWWRISCVGGEQFLMCTSVCSARNNLAPIESSRTNLCEAFLNNTATARTWPRLVKAYSL